MPELSEPSAPPVPAGLPELTFTRLAGTSDSGTLLVVGPSLGTSVEALWGRAAGLLDAEVVGWDLPGHGRSAPTTRAFTIADLARVVAREVEVLAAGRPASYAGVSLGGAVALQLALEPGVLDHVVCIASAARIGEPDMWADRASLVRRAGTPVMVEPSAGRWFAPGFVEREPTVADRLLLSLSDADGESYALACEALAGFDLLDLIGEVLVDGLVDGGPRLVVAPGELDVVVPVELAERTAAAAGAELVVLPGCGHLPPAEDPAAVASLLRGLRRTRRPPMDDTYDEGMRTRREVLGDAHVDRAEAGTSPFTADFQELITRYAWGSVWTRPGLDRRTRSVATLTALIALGHWEELALHVLAARRNGLSAEEIAEVILQSGIYCGVPAANHAFGVAKQVLDTMEEGS